MSFLRFDFLFAVHCIVSPSSPRSNQRLDVHKKGMPANLWCWNFKSGAAQPAQPLYDFKREFERLGVPSAQWRVTDINSEYKFCDTYPSLLAVPASVDDELLKSASAFRSRARIPVLAYRHPNGSVMTRSSQPAVGIGMKRSKDDERLLADIAATNPQNPILPIFDARPKVNAVANTAMGFGWELISHYPGCTLTFCGIENIHVMRNSYFRVRDMMQSSNETPNWFGSIHESGWLGHQQLILHWSIKLADLLHVQNTSCLVHCSTYNPHTSIHHVLTPFLAS
jgi:myotubularin-related protein 1/2